MSMLMSVVKYVRKDWPSLLVVALALATMEGQRLEIGRQKALTEEWRLTSHEMATQAGLLAGRVLELRQQVDSCERTYPRSEGDEDYGRFDIKRRY